MEVIAQRHSVKNYTSQSVPCDKIKRMVSAASLAPSWKNQQDWKIIIVDDETIKSNIASAIPDSNSAKPAINEAPIVAVLCIMPRCEGETKDKDYYMMDAGITMEHFVLAAVNEGLGTCWIGEFDEEALRNTLDVPREYRIVAMTPVGYPRDVCEKTVKKDLSDLVYKNEWDNPIKFN